MGSSLQPIQNYKDFGTETVGLKQYFEALLHKHKLGQKSADSMHCYHQNHSGFNTQTFKSTSKGVTYTFLKSASLGRKVVDKKNKLVDQRGPKVAWMPKILP